MFCGKCGEPVPEGGTFCPQCGSQILEGPAIDDRPEATGGVLPNRDIMLEAKGSLKGKWGLAIATVVVFYIVTTAIQFIPILGSLGSILISGPMIVGLFIFVLALSRGRDAQLSQIFWGFRRFGVCLGAYLLFGILILLWTLLLIIPGIIALFSYSQTFMVLADNDSIGPIDALKKSKQIMKGHKWKFFCLWMRFIGWFLLCILTLGIGFLWLIPYMLTSCARFYDDINVERDEPVSLWSP